MSTKLSVDAIRARAAKFAKRFEGVTSEKSHDQDFMRGLCDVFGVNLDRLRWQFKLKNGKTTTWADGVLPGMALFEIKSAGEDLDDAHDQAARYVQNMQDVDVPRLIIVSDFARIHVYQGASRVEICLADLPQQIEHLMLLAGYEVIAVKRQSMANEAAALKLGKLHDVMKANGYEGHDLESYLVRLLFCLFAEDTGLFGERNKFLNLLLNTKVDGADLNGELEQLFHILNKPDGQNRLKGIPERFHGFPYVNGDLFAGRLDTPYSFDEDSRKLLLELAGDDWGDIDPSIFGSLFQAIMHHEDEKAGKSKKRRELGAHYTSEENILKVIRPLFLDALWAEFEKTKHNKKLLFAFQEKLARLQFFDPACGCGNFLVVAYRELRLLELEVVRKLYGNASGQVGDVSLLARVDVHQFHGIEIDSTAARIAVVAMWLTDHQMNMRLQQLGVYYHRLPLRKRANIVCANALRIDWRDVISAEKVSYILGNPPFGGKHYQNKEQREDQELITAGIKSGSDLDYVANWFIKATEYIDKTEIPVAFVATNSITQGEQVSLLWGYLFGHSKLAITFAHRTFKWSNDARGKAAVHCVIIGFSLSNNRMAESYQPCRLFDYEKPDSEPNEIVVKCISPYLVDGPNLVVTKRSTPLMDVPRMRYGNKPSDNGCFILSPVERRALIAAEPISEKWIKRYVGSDDFINGIERWCLWLADIQPTELRSMPMVLKRVESVRAFRAASSAAPTRKSADTPTQFFYKSQPATPYIVVPEVSSERRKYIPIGFLTSDIICSNTNYLIPTADMYIFGVLTSAMHMAWVRTVCGRLKSDYRYSGSIVYNNFPWPMDVTEKQRVAIEAAAQGVLDTRAVFPESTLADLYDPLSMPPALTKAHQVLDRAVDSAYVASGGKKSWAADADRVAFLFTKYAELIAARV